MKTIASAATLLALFTVTAFAQSDATQAPSAKAPATTMQKGAIDGTVDQTQGMQKGTSDQTGSTTQAPPATGDALNGLATVDPKTKFLASKLIGQKVYSANNESLGSISDLALDNQKGDIIAIVAVGGLMGLGARDVAVKLNNLSMATKNNSPYLTMNATRDQLAAAPAFDPTKMTNNIGQ